MPDRAAQPRESDLVLVGEDGGARFELLESGSADGDAIVTTDAANRLLTLWGRRSVRRPVEIDASPAVSDRVASVLWPDAVPWPAR